MTYRYVEWENDWPKTSERRIGERLADRLTVHREVKTQAEGGKLLKRILAKRPEECAGYIFHGLRP